MKTHLPHGLRAALMAAIATVSLTAGFTAFAGSSAQAAGGNITWNSGIYPNDGVYRDITRDNIYVNGGTFYIAPPAYRETPLKANISSVTVASGAIFGIGCNQGTIGTLTLNGGKLYHENMNGNIMATQHLTIQNLNIGANSVFEIYRKGVLDITSMTGTSNLVINKENLSDIFTLNIGSITNYSGTISVNYPTNVKMYIKAANQAAGKTATVTSTTNVYLQSGFTKTGEGTLALRDASLAGNATISAGSVQVQSINLHLQGNTISLKDSGSLQVDGFTYTALAGKTGTITSSAKDLYIFDNKAETTLKDLVLSTFSKAISVKLDNVSLVSATATGNEKFWLTGSGIAKNLADVSTKGTLYIGAGDFGKGDTIAATISGTANVGSLEIGSNATLAVKAGGELHVGNAIATTDVRKLQMASGSTLSVKEGDLFAAGAENTFSISGVTLAANEGNWTLNKAATINGVTISGNAAVGLGSEVDNAAVVSLSGNIDATKGNLILKNTAVGAGKTATLSGNLTFEGTVQNSGTLSLANGSTINIDEESLMRNGRFIDGADINASDKNGFFADEEVCLSTGGAYSYDKAQLTLTLDGVKDSRLVLMKDNEKNQLLIAGLSLANTYFVREGDVTYSHITGVAKAISRDVKEIAVGNDGVGDTHQLTLDTALSDGVTIVSASDNAKVSVAGGVELNASQTAVKGEANEVHVVGDGSVLMDDASKLSQLAGDAAMKVKQNTSFSSEAKMTGALEVSEGATLSVRESGSVSSFSTVKLDEGTTLKSEVASNGTINALSGDGTLSKTGTGTLSISGDASAFNGAVELEAGTLEVGQSVTLSAAKGATIGTNGVLLNDGVIGGELAVSGTLKGSGTMATTTIEEAGQLIVGNSPGKQTYTGDLTVKGAVDFSVDDLFGVPATAETSGWGNGTHSVIDMDGHSIFLNGNITLTLGTVVAGQLDDEGIFELVLVQNIGNAADYTAEKLTDLYSATSFTDMEGVVVSSAPMLDHAHYEMKDNNLVLTNTPTTPEPATATLSLLALAGLAARRKRK